MIDLQQALVADHITSLEREAAALRAERVRDRAVASTQPSRRVRLGRWLVGIGESISGSTAPMARSFAGDEQPCDDEAESLPRAA